MTDQRVSDLTNVTSVGATDEIHVATGGNSRATTRTVLEESFQTPNVFKATSPEYGVVQGATDQRTALQSAIDAAATAVLANGKSAIVYLPGGTFYSGAGLLMKERVMLVGDRMASTELRLLDGENADFILTPNFATLTGTNVWLDSEGVLQHIGFENIRIHGNKANQTSGDVLKLIAKGIYFGGNVVITDGFGVGLYTEAGESATVNQWPTNPEGNVGFLQIQRCGSHGFHQRGPHDMYVSKITSFINGGKGVFIESASSQYSAQGVDYADLHCYSNTGINLHVKDTARVKIAKLRAETGVAEGVSLENADNFQVGMAQIVGNGTTSGTYQMLVDSSSSNCQGRLEISRAGRAAIGCLQVAGVGNTFEGILLGTGDSGASTGVGLDVPANANYNKLSFVFNNFTGTGATGLRLKNGGSNIGNQIDCVLQGCDTAFENASAGVGNQVKLTGRMNSGQTMVAASPAQPGIGSNRELFDITLSDADNNYVASEENILSSGTVDLNTTALQTINVTINPVTTPRIQDVTVDFYEPGTNPEWTTPPYVFSISASQIQIRCLVASALGGGEVGNLLVKYRV